MILSVHLNLQRASFSKREPQPLHKKRMDTETFQKQMERLLLDTDKRRLSCESKKPIPDVIFTEKDRGRLRTLPPELQKEFLGENGTYSELQQNAINSRRLRGDQKHQDWFGLREFESEKEGICFALHDQVDLNLVKEERQHFGALFLAGSVAAVTIRGHLDETGNLIPYDGNDDCIINMGLVAGNITHRAHILFGWEVIQEFFIAISTSPTNFLRFFETKIHTWCEGIRRHIGKIFSELRCFGKFLTIMFFLSRKAHYRLQMLLGILAWENVFDITSEHVWLLVLWNFISGLASRFPMLFEGLRFGPKGLEDEFYRSLYDAFRNACLDYKNLMAVNWDACFTCTCTFKEMGPCQIIYDNACNLINWVSHIHISHTHILQSHSEC